MNTKLIQRNLIKFDLKHITGMMLGTLAISTLTFSLTRPAYSANVSNGSLNCTTQVNRTAATATCTGAGKWRLRIDCAYQGDYEGEMVSQKGGTVQQRGECRFKARNATVEFN
jgi:hypothetical protein